MHAKRLNVLLAATALLVAGCGSAESPPKPGTPTGAATTTSGAAAPAPSPTTTMRPSSSGTPTASGDCGQPPDGVKELIDGSFNGGEKLQDVFAVSGPGNLIYVGGNIIGSDGTKESSADVWLVKNEGIYVVYSLSSDARRRTTWPDGRDLASAGDQYGAAVQDCVTSAERARNLGGG